MVRCKLPGGSRRQCSRSHSAEIYDTLAADPTGGIKHGTAKKKDEIQVLAMKR